MLYNNNLINTGIIALNSVAGVKNEPATYIVMGVPRSGTSMVAKSLVELGVFMGSKLDKAVFEDVEIADAIESDKASLPSLIAERNREYDVWGFKRPTAYKHLQGSLKKFRNPKLIITFRDPVAIAKRNNISVFSDFTHGLTVANKENAELVSFLSKQKIPVLLISYEKAMSGKQRFAKELANFCGVNTSPKVLKKVAEIMVNGPPRYLDSSRVKLEGHIDFIKDGFVTGWAHQIGSKRVLTVRVESEGKVLGKGVANIFRNDLKLANKAQGNCSFKVKVGSIASGTVVKVMAEPFNQMIARKKA